MILSLDRKTAYCVTLFGTRHVCIMTYNESQSLNDGIKFELNHNDELVAGNTHRKFSFYSNFLSRAIIESIAACFRRNVE